jgi:carboxyl-terminal processing protease
MSIAERSMAQGSLVGNARAGIWKVLVVALLYSVSLGLQAKADSSKVYEPVAPTIDQARANILIARQLQFTHFRNLTINDELSGEVFDAYLDYLDGQRIYLTQEDLKKIQPG